MDISGLNLPGRQEDWWQVKDTTSFCEARPSSYHEGGMCRRDLYGTI